MPIDKNADKNAIWVAMRSLDRVRFIGEEIVVGGFTKQWIVNQISS